MGIIQRSLKSALIYPSVIVLGGLRGALKWSTIMQRDVSGVEIFFPVWTIRINIHSLSERLASLGIMGASPLCRIIIRHNGDIIIIPLTPPEMV